jgi:hypothetical protein
MKYFAIEDNDLLTYLSGLFGEHRVQYAKEQYLIGTSRLYPRAAIFWYVSVCYGEDPIVHFGKIMKYDSTTGRRLKEPNSVNSVNRMIKDNRKINGTLFGIHLAQKNTDAPIYVVESEKSAIIASIFFPEMVWVATGSLYNLKPSRFFTIAKREIHLIPDSGGFEAWKDKAEKEFRWNGIKVAEVRSLEHWPRGYDVADILLDAYTKKPKQIATDTNENNN